MKSFTLLILWLFFYSCVGEDEPIPQKIMVNFKPSIHMEQIPFEQIPAKSVASTAIIGLIYEGDDLVSIAGFQNGKYEAELQYGRTYHVIFIGNGSEFIQEAEQFSTAKIVLENLSPGKFGNEIYISDDITFTPKTTPVSVSATLERIIGAISFTSVDDPFPADIKEVSTTIDRIGVSYNLKNKKIESKQITIVSDEISAYGFMVYSFIFPEQECRIVSTIKYKDNTMKIWDMGYYPQKTNHLYKLTGKLKAQQ